VLRVELVLSFGSCRQADLSFKFLTSPPGPLSFEERGKRGPGG